MYSILLQPNGTNGVQAWDNPVYGMYTQANPSSVSAALENEGHHSPPRRRATGSFSAIAVAKNPRYERLSSPPPPSSQSGGRQLTTDYHHYDLVSQSGETEGDYATINEFTGAK